MPLLSEKNKILLQLFLPQRRKPNPKFAIPEADKNLAGKIIVFTGGTDGFGRDAVRTFYNMGATIALLARSKNKAELVINELTASGGTGSITFFECDLSSMTSTKACAEQLIATYEKIDVLVNNAGVNMTQRVITDEGFETAWATNYLGPYLLTQLLLDKIKAAGNARIVNVTTNTNFLDELDIDYIESKPDFATRATYVESKLSLNMFSIDLASALQSSGVTVNYLYPGYIKSNLLRNLQGGEKMMQFFMNVMASPPEVGADRIVRLAISSAYNGFSGVYVAEDENLPAHSEAQLAKKRQHIARITQQALAKWL